MNDRDLQPGMFVTFAFDTGVFPIPLIGTIVECYDYFIIATVKRLDEEFPYYPVLARYNRNTISEIVQIDEVPYNLMIS